MDQVSYAMIFHIRRSETLTNDVVGKYQIVGSGPSEYMLARRLDEDYNVTPATGADHGHKLYISVCSSDRDKALALLVDVFYRNGVERFKFSPTTLDAYEGPQQGKGIVVYDNPCVNWRSLVTEVETILADNNIGLGEQPGPTKTIPKSRYLYFRCDAKIAPDGEIEYQDAQVVRKMAAIERIPIVGALSRRLHLLRGFDSHNIHNPYHYPHALEEIGTGPYGSGGFCP